MGRINWPRVLLCGLVTGGIWTLLSVILVALVGQEFMSALNSMGRSSPRGSLPFPLIANVAGGIWAIWLYAAIRPRYGAGPKTAVLAACGWWFIQSLQSAKWVAVLGVSSDLGLYPLAAGTLAAMIVAVVAGAWLYQE